MKRTKKIQYNGRIDQSECGIISGWVDGGNLSRFSDVEIVLSNGWSQIVTKDQLRVEDSRMRFHVTVPYSLFDRDDISVEAKVLGSDQLLPGSGKTVTPDFPFELMAGDIVNNCNLRCPFCLTDYANVRRTKTMPEETFRRAIELMPLVPDNNFWLSCMHEATLHPQMQALIGVIPDNLRSKVSLTMNLCKKLSDEFIEELADSGFSSIRISVDSIDPELFGRLRKGGRFSVFEDNLRRLATYLEKSDRRPNIHFISMVFADNIDEMPDLVRWCDQVTEAQVHELRFMYYLPHVSEWGEKHILSLDAWNNLKLRMGEESYFPKILFSEPEDGAHEKFALKPGVETYESPVAVFGGLATPEDYLQVDPIALGTVIPDEPFRMRMRWDGLLMMEQLREDDFRQNVLEVGPDYFYRMRRKASRSRGAWKRR